jgi:hypothetical protein
VLRYLLRRKGRKRHWGGAVCVLWKWDVGVVSRCVCGARVLRRTAHPCVDMPRARGISCARHMCRVRA